MNTADWDESARVPKPGQCRRKVAASGGGATAPRLKIRWRRPSWVQTPPLALPTIDVGRMPAPRLRASQCATPWDSANRRGGCLTFHPVPRDICGPASRQSMQGCWAPLCLNSQASWRLPIGCPRSAPSSSRSCRSGSGLSRRNPRRQVGWARKRRSLPW